MTSKVGVLIDAGALIHTAFSVAPKLSAVHAANTGATFVFCRMVLNALTEFSPTVAYFVEDSKCSMRTTIWPTYKSDRVGSRDNWDMSQVAAMRDAIRLLGIQAVKTQGVEADDWIATLCCNLSKHDYYSRIVSRDKDFLQLVRDPEVQMYDFGRHTLLGEEHAMRKFSVLPHQVPDVQALQGDRVDGYSGVPSIGAVRAAALINQFGSLENLYANLDDVVHAGRREKLREHEKEARIFKSLATLRTDIDIPTGLRDPASHTVRDSMDKEELQNFMRLHEFQTLEEAMLQHIRLQTIMS